MQRFSLTNKTFTIGINQYPPFIRIDVDGSTILGGFEIKILYLLRDYFNFSTKFINTHDNYGKLLTNGTWTGMFGNLTTNQMDLSISGAVISDDRIRNNISFLHPHWQEQYTFATLPPRMVRSHNIDIFLRPFEMNVWLALFIMLILLNLINIFVSLYFRKNNIQQIKQDHHHKHHLPWSFSIRLLLNQSYHWSYWNRMAISMKFILITWSFAILILNQHYVSFLFAFISLSPTMPAIDSIEKLEKECLKKNVEIFVDSGSFMSSALKRTKDPIMKNIHRCLTAISNERGIIPPQMLYDDYTSNYNELNQQKQEHQKVMKRRSKKRWKQYAYINSKSRLTYALLILGPGSIYIPALNDDFRTTLLLTHVAIPTSPSFRPYRHSFERV
ncbi:glutamate receptor-like [Dermatophagoides pteronyssinus]|uniref:glutamate receptor-like n=1 Tax=Dermatophagoides pteronyssinus TaxID=6956 RepID=UPI003F669E83